MDAAVVAQPIIDRLRKLMAMAERGTQHEAALAGERMQAIMQEYNLTQADIGGDEGPEDPTKVAREKRDHGATALYVYQRGLMAAIAQNNFCLHFISANWINTPTGKRARWDSEKQDYVKCARRKVHRLIGRSENVTAATLMYDYLIDTMRRLLPFAGKDRHGSDARLWLTGCAEVLCERLAQQRTGAERARGVVADNTPGLVRLADLYGTEEDLNNDFRMGHEPGTTARRHREHEVEQARIKAKFHDLLHEGVGTNEAWYRANGWEYTKDTTPTQTRRETPSERERRERVDDNQYRREAYREARERTRERNKRSNPSFRAGRSTGENIGLGGGLGSGSKGSISAKD